MPSCEGQQKKRVSRAELRRAKKGKKNGAPDGVPAERVEADSAAPAAAPGGIERLAPGGAGRGTPKYTFSAADEDHCETDVAAYRHLAPLLSELALALGRDGGAPGQQEGGGQGPAAAAAPSALRIWDPYYCTGAAARNLAAEGFPRVHNKNEDFYEVLRTGRVPEHDVLVTNPPYSGDHLERCVRWCAGSGMPWCLLMPHWVAAKPWYRQVLRVEPALRATAPFHLGPAEGAYQFWIPAGVPRPAHVGADGRTVPFRACWYCHLPVPGTARRLLERLEARQRHGGCAYVTAKTVKGLRWRARGAAARAERAAGSREPHAPGWVHGAAPQAGRRQRKARRT